MNWKTIAAVAVTLLFWSSAFAGIRAGLAGGYTPGHLVLLRFLSASAVFAVYALVRGVKVPELRDLPRIVWLSLVGITIYHVSLTYGEVHVPAGTASLLIAAAPAITALIASTVLQERLNAVGWCGILLGFAGIALITFGSGQEQGFTHDALLILLSAFCTSIFFVFQKPLFERYSAVDLTAYFTWIGTVPMVVFAPGLWGQLAHVPAAATIAAVYIGVFPAAVAYVAWAVALSLGRAANVASALYINPVLAIIFGWLWLGELPHWMSIVGGVIALAGVITVNVWGSRPTRGGHSSREPAASTQDG